MALRSSPCVSNPKILRQIEELPWLRFELVEHIRLPKDSTFASMCEFGPLVLG